jgi:hypothetical protein
MSTADICGGGHISSRQLILPDVGPVERASLARVVIQTIRKYSRFLAPPECLEHLRVQRHVHR